MRSEGEPFLQKEGGQIASCLPSSSDDDGDVVTRWIKDSESMMDFTARRFVIDRQAHTEKGFQLLLGKIKLQNEQLTTFEKICAEAKSRARCSKESCASFFLKLFPIITWLREYRLREWLPGDIVSGLTVGIVHIPQSLAFSLLAGLAPVFGLYTSFYPVLIYTLMGTSRHISVGTFAVTSLLTRAVVQRHVPDIEQSIVVTNVTSTMTATSIDDMTLGGFSELDLKRAKVAASLTLIMGIFQILFGIFRLGVITTYLSEPLIQGFTTGAACQVVTSQFPTILGIRIGSFSGPFALIFSWIDIFRNLPKVHVATLVISILCVIFLVIGREINLRFKEKLPIPIPTEVILVIITILASHFGRFQAVFGVTIVDNIPTGLPTPQLPEVSILGSIIGDGFAIAIVGFAISVSLAKMYGTKHGYAIDPNQELVAYGISNFIPAFFLCFPNAAALARCEIQDNTGGKTQVVGIISVIIVLIAILVLAPVFEPLPRTVLACIIVVGLFGILAQFKNLKTIYKNSKVDFVIWLVTWAAVVVLGVDIGLLVGVVFAIITVIFRTQKPRCEILVNIPETDIYRAKGSCTEENTLPGIFIFKFYGTLYYANRDIFRKNLVKALGYDPAFVLSQRKKLQQEIELETERIKKTLVRNGKKKKGEDVENHQNITGQASDSSANIIEMNVISQREPNWNTEDIHTVILDCGCFTFIDYVGAKLLKQLCSQFKELGISFLLATCCADVRRTLKANNYFEISGEEAAFITVHDAVVYTMFSKTSVEAEEYNDNNTMTLNSIE